MAVTTGTPDEEPEDRTRDRKRVADMAARILSADEPMDMEAVQKLLASWKVADHVDLRSVHVHGPVIGRQVTSDRQPGKDTEQPRRTLAEQRQELYFGLLREQQTSYFDSWSQDRKQANVAFWAAVVLMLASGLVLLAGGVMSLIQGNLQPLATASLPGVPFATIGAGLALYARKTKVDTIARANRVEEQIVKSHELQTALTLVDEFEDPEKRDNMRATVVMKTLGLQPNPETVTDRLLPGAGADGKGEIESGGSKS